MPELPRFENTRPAAVRTAWHASATLGRQLIVVCDIFRPFHIVQGALTDTLVLSL